MAVPAHPRQALAPHAASDLPPTLEAAPVVRSDTRRAPGPWQRVDGVRMTTATAAPVSPSTLLVTKLRPPRLSRDVVPRLQLIDRLLAGFEGPLTLVTAPAGFGK